MNLIFYHLNWLIQNFTSFSYFFFKVASYDIVLKRMALSLAELDVASSLALLAVYRGFIRPTMVEGTKFEVTGGRHPVVDIMQPDSFVNNDCNLTEKHVWIVTGPNMGGKISKDISHFQGLNIYVLVLTGFSATGAIVWIETKWRHASSKYVRATSFLGLVTRRESREQVWLPSKITS